MQDFPKADLADLTQVHAREFVERVRDLPSQEAANEMATQYDSVYLTPVRRVGRGVASCLHAISKRVEGDGEFHNDRLGLVDERALTIQRQSL